MKITAKTAAKADAYRLQRVTTPENLEMKMMHNGGVVITFGERILIAGYYYQPSGDCYYAAIYRFTTADHTCEGEIRLEAISTEMYPDNGSAIAWCIGNCR